MISLPVLLAVLAVQDAPHGSSPPLIDNYISARLADERAKPAGRSDDSEFLRRVYLDITGVIPPAEAVRRFLDDRRPDKRELLIEELLAGDAYAEHWADYWQSLLLGYDALRALQTPGRLRGWLQREVFAKNMPYDRMVRELVGASGSSNEKDATRFLLSQYERGNKHTDVLDQTYRVFLGTQIQCAQCHDHPFDRTTQEEYYANVAFFVRTAVKKAKPNDPKDPERILFENARGEATLPGLPKAQPIAPRTLDGLTPDPAAPRREEFARLITRPDNLQFARALVNRYWGHFFGRGIVHPVDAFNERNRPTHPELLDALARDFVRSRFDLKHLIRTICLSETYQRTSRRSPTNARQEALYGVAPVRAMSPEQLYRSVLRATGLDERYRSARAPEAVAKFEKEKLGYLRSFRSLFGDPEAVGPPEFHGTIPQALAMLNGDLVNRRMQEKNAQLDLILRTHTRPGEPLDLIYMSVLSRPPTTAERKRHTEYLARNGNRKSAYEDIMWALLNSSEFMFIH